MSGSQGLDTSKKFNSRTGLETMHIRTKFAQRRCRICLLYSKPYGNLSTLCQPVSSVPGRRHLRSARRGELDFPRVNLATYRERAFVYAGPTSWNSLPDSLKDIHLTL